MTLPSLLQDENDSLQSTMSTSGIGPLSSNSTVDTQCGSSRVESSSSPFDIRRNSSIKDSRSTFDTRSGSPANEFSSCTIHSWCGSSTTNDSSSPSDTNANSSTSSVIEEPRKSSLVGGIGPRLSKWIIIDGDFFSSNYFHHAFAV